jgi:hypothetical protein
MMCAGMDPVIYLVPGHAYPGFRMNGKYYAIESTGIGGEGMGGRSSAQEAYQMGMKSLEKFIQSVQSGDTRYMILDVREAIKNGALAMELKDDNFLRQKIDELAQSFDGSGVPQQVSLSTISADNTGGGGGGNDDDNPGGGGGDQNTGGSLPSGYRSFQGPISFGYPGSWHQLRRESHWPPQMTHAFSNSARTTYVEVYNFPGYGSPQQAMYAIQQFIQGMGGYVEYQNAGQSGGFVLYNGTTTFSGGGLNWVAAFRSTGNGVAGVAIGANFGVNAEGTAQKILSTLR